MRAFLFTLLVLLSIPVVALAQVKPEVRPFVGAFVPTGAQRDVLQDAVLGGAQVAVEAADVVHLVGTFAFIGPDFNNRITYSGHMHVYQSDVGAELFGDMALKNEWRFRPFVGAGMGVRTYDMTAANGSRSYPAGYGTLGGEFQLNRVALRIEARDYVSSFKGIDGKEDASTRNDIALTLGMSYHLR